MSSVRRMLTVTAAILLAALCTLTPNAWAVTKTCLTGTAPVVAGDLSQITATRAAIEADCPCGIFDGSRGLTHSAFMNCVRGAINAQITADRLRPQCKSTVTSYYSASTCGVPLGKHVVPCLNRTRNGKVTCSVKASIKCTGAAAAVCATATTCIDAADTNANGRIDPNDTGSCALPKPLLTTTSVPTHLPILHDHNIPFDQLTVSSALSQVTLGPGDVLANITFADTGKGQLVFVENPDGSILLVAYFTAAEISSGTIAITLDSVARGLVMGNPLMFGFGDTDRLTILDHAEHDPLFATLKDEINQDLQLEPRSLLQPAVFPNVFKYPGQLIVNALHDSATLIHTVRSTAGDAIPPPVAGSGSAPYFGDAPGAAVIAVDPTMLFYGIDIQNQSPQLIAGKDSLWELHFGWPPATFTSPVTKALTLGDGTFHATFMTYGVQSRAAEMAAVANVLRAGCDVLDAIFWCPASNALIEQATEGALDDALITAAHDLFVVDTADGVVDRLGVMIDLLQRKEVWTAITRALYSSATDKAVAVAFLQDSKAFLKAAAKVLDAYDAANVYVPFIWDVINKPSVVAFCLTQTNGILSNTCEAVPPAAVIVKMSPDHIYVDDVVVFDASHSSDDQTDLGSLQVRWDFDGDGTFDTDWTTDKQGTWSYSVVGSYTVKLEVRDAAKLVGQTVYNVLVDASTAGGAATHIKAFRNVLPWDTSSFEDTMAANGFSEGVGPQQYEVLSSSQFANEILTPAQDLVVIMNDQDQAFYDDLAAASTRVTRFIQNGGVLVWGAADLGWHNGSMATAGINQLPGGVGYTAVFDRTNYNVNPTSILMSGLPDTLTGTYASHEHFTNVPMDAITYLVDTGGFPTLSEYNQGSGWVMLIGQPLEYNVQYDPGSMGLVYPRLFNYVLGRVGGGAAAGGQQAARLRARLLQPALSHITVQ